MKAASDEKRTQENAKEAAFYFDKELRKFGIKDKNDKIVVHPKYSIYGGGRDGIYEVKDESKFGFVDMNQLGKEIIPLMYTASRTVFSEGLVAVELDGKWGFIDMAGKTIIPFRYDLAKNFKDGFAEVILNNAIIYIDRQGNTIK